ncbi:MAG: hypothetical protein AVDCRST_MAG41-412, partial [uncultured Corynebacteriales bacterium]
ADRDRAGRRGRRRGGAGAARARAERVARHRRGRPGPGGGPAPGPPRPAGPRRDTGHRHPERRNVAHRSLAPAVASRQTPGRGGAHATPLAPSGGLV